MLKPQLIIVRGLPGSGKSTFVRKQFPGTFHIENDMLAVQHGIYSFYRNPWKDVIHVKEEIIKKAMTLGCDIVVSDTFCAKEHVQTLLDLADAWDYEVTIYRCTGNYGSVHDVPEETLEKMRKIFVPIEGEIILDS